MSLQRSALEVMIAVREGHVRVYSVHLTHLSAATRLPQVDACAGESMRTRSARGRAISRGGPDDEWTRDGMPPPTPREAILLGDFKPGPGLRRVAERIVGPMSPYGGRITNPEGFRRRLGGVRQRDALRSDGGGARPSVTARLLLRQRRTEGSDPFGRRSTRMRLVPTINRSGSKSTCSPHFSQGCAFSPSESGGRAWNACAASGGLLIFASAAVTS